MIIAQCINPFVDEKKYMYQFCIVDSECGGYINVKFYNSNIEGLHRWRKSRFNTIGL